MIRAAHAWGYRPPEGQGESRIHLSRVKRLAVVGACLALALTGCSFQGLNSLPLPGAVGRGPDAVTYHVEVPNVATLESNSPVMINDVVVGSVGKMTVDALARQRGDLRQARRRGACQCGSHRWADQPAGIHAPGAQPAAR